MKKFLLFILVLLFTNSSVPSKKEKKQQIIYYNIDNYKYDDDLMIRNSKKIEKKESKIYD